MCCEYSHFYIHIECSRAQKTVNWSQESLHSFTPKVKWSGPVAAR